jgi:hypothetical protein
MMWKFFVTIIKLLLPSMNLEILMKIFCKKLLSFLSQSIGKLCLFFYISDQLIVKDVLQWSKMKKESKKIALMKSLNR